jgi:FkbM family methyltransferase
MNKTYFKLRIIFLFAHPIKSFKKILKPSLNISNIDKSKFSKYLGKINSIIEAGAADGVDTMEFTIIFPNAHIFAIEPVSDQFNHLKNKFKEKENISLHKIALDSKSGVTEIHIGSNTGYLQGRGSSSLMKPTKHKDMFPEIKFNLTEKVRTQTLTDFCSFNDRHQRLRVIYVTNTPANRTMFTQGFTQFITYDGIRFFITGLKEK